MELQSKPQTQTTTFHGKEERSILRLLRKKTFWSFLPECALRYQLPLKNTNPLFLAKHPRPLKSANCPRPPSLYWFLWPPLKVRYLSEAPKYKSFSFVTPHYLLKLTELVKIFQFQILIYFLCENCTLPLPKKVIAIFPRNAPLIV